MPTSTRYRALSVAILVCAVVEIGAVLAGWRLPEYVLKPLTMLLVIGVAAGRIPGGDPWYRRLVLAGLLFSLCGDVFLMWPGDLFMPGLASFLVGHLFYLAAFTRGGWRATAATSAACAAFLGVLLWVLLPQVGALRVPVAVYGTAICAMAWQAIERHRAIGSAATRLAAFGAVLFVLSDGTLSVNRFVAPFWISPLVVMGTYFAAQWFIASSVAAGQERFTR